jgi:hypothetical protein
VITDHELDTLLRLVLADEAALFEDEAPSLDRAVATLRPRVRSQSGETRRLMFVLAAALLLIAAMASAIAVGAWLRTTIDAPRSRQYAEEFQAVGLLPTGAAPQAIVAVPDGSALLVGEEALFRLDPETLQFTQVGTLRIARIHPQAVALQDGRVLIVGGGPHDSQLPPPNDYPAEIFDPSSGASTLTGSTVNQCGDWCTALLLEDGRVLVVGGNEPELFDPARGEFTEIGVCLPCQSAGAALLDSGRVLIVGGGGAGEPASAVLFDPQRGTFVAAGAMAIPQESGFTLTRLTDGRFLIVGGWDDTGNVISAAQIYDPITDRFTRTGSLPAPRTRQSAALLADGRVLVVGGWDAGEDALTEGDDAFIYDPATGAFKPTASLTVQRLAPFVVTLAAGRVLVAGSQCWNQGCYGLGDPPSLVNRENSAEVFK